MDEVKAAVYTRARWKQVGYCYLRMPVSVVLFAIVVGAWAGSLAMVVLPAHVAALPRDAAQLGLFGLSEGARRVGGSARGCRGVSWPPLPGSPSTVTPPA